jgi:4-hydroxybenzoate polyprenyltransferase
MRARRVRSWLRHLRLGFNVLLSPIYLWGAYVAPFDADPWRLAVGWLALHVFLYGGTTAFNSYFDRDLGPIGGMRHPEPIEPGLLTWSVLVQLAGLPLAWVLSPAFAVVYVLLGLTAAAYSHPRSRWKSRPLPALLAVALGQGGLGTMAGWWAAAGPEARPLVDLAAPGPWWAATVAALVLIGQYVVSQAYQADEDRKRGDVTLVVLLGPQRALRWALVPAALGALALFGTVAALDGWPLALPGALLGAVIAGHQLRFAASVGRHGIDADYRAAMRLVRLGGLSLSVYLLALLAFA